MASSSTLVTPNATEGKSWYLLSDYDGTITTRDSNDCATDDLGFGEARRRELNVEILNGRPFRDAFAEMLESICKNGHSFEEVRQYLIKRTSLFLASRIPVVDDFPPCFPHAFRADIGLDPGFQECFKWCEENDIPVVIVSSGMKVRLAVLSSPCRPP